jgi:hypothetical protein
VFESMKRFNRLIHAYMWHLLTSCHV